MRRIIFEITSSFGHIITPNIKHYIKRRFERQQNLRASQSLHQPYHTVQECLLGFIIETIHANLNCLCFVSEDRVCLHNVNQAAGADDLFNTTIIEGLTDDVCPISKTLDEVLISADRSSLLRILVSLATVGYSCSKVTGKRSRNASLRTLVPMKRPSSDPLPLVLAVAMTLNPAEGLTNLTNLFQGTPLPSRID